MVSWAQRGTLSTSTGASQMSGSNWGSKGTRGSSWSSDMVSGQDSGGSGSSAGIKRASRPTKMQRQWSMNRDLPPGAGFGGNVGARKPGSSDGHQVFPRAQSRLSDVGMRGLGHDATKEVERPPYHRRNTFQSSVCNEAPSRKPSPPTPGKGRPKGQWMAAEEEKWAAAYCEPRRIVKKQPTRTNGNLLPPEHCKVAPVSDSESTTYPSTSTTMPSGSEEFRSSPEATEAFLGPMTTHHEYLGTRESDMPGLAF